MIPFDIFSVGWKNACIVWFMYMLAYLMEHRITKMNDRSQHTLDVYFMRFQVSCYSS